MEAPLGWNSALSGTLCRVVLRSQCVVLRHGAREKIIRDAEFRFERLTPGVAREHIPDEFCLRVRGHGLIVIHLTEGRREIDADASVSAQALVRSASSTSAFPVSPHGAQVTRFSPFGFPVRMKFFT